MPLSHTHHRWVLPFCFLITFCAAACQQQSDSQSRESTTADKNRTADTVIEIFNWDLDKGVLTHLLFSPNDRLLLAFVGNKDKKNTGRIIVLDSLDAHDVYNVESKFPIAMSYSPDGSRLAVLAADDISLHHIFRKEVLIRIDRQTFGEDIRAIGFTDDGSVIVGGGQYLNPEVGRVAWHTETGESIEVPSAAVTWAGRGLSQDGSMFFSGGWPGPTPRIYKTDLSARLCYCYRDEWPIAAGFMPGGDRFVSIHEDGLLVVWAIVNTDDNAPQLYSAPGFGESIAFAVSNNRKRIALARNDGSVIIRKFPVGETDRNE